MHVVRAEKAIEPEVSSLSAVDYDELARRIEDGDTSMVLVSVLPRASFEAGRIPGSVNLPLEEIAERAGEVLPARDQETVVYCASSACSLAEQGVALLRGLGYTRVREYPGGLEEWTERGGRIEHAVTFTPKADPPPAGRLDRLRRVLARLSPPALFTWATNQSLRVLFGIWLGTSVLFALFYWGMSGLVTDGGPIGKDLAGLSTAFWFSLAKAMTWDLGGVSAVGWMRLAVRAETLTGLVLFGSLVSKMMEDQQEEVLDKVYRLTHENRLGRLRTNLHLILSELAEVAGECSSPMVSPRRLRTRIETVAMVFAGEVQAVGDLVRGGPGSADKASLETLLGCVASGLEELSHLLTCLPSGRAHSGSLRRSLRRISQLGADVCATCTVEPPTPALRGWMDRVQRLCRALCDEPRLGDPAPRFELPGSDGRVHRLADYLGQRPVVLIWFPQVFTGG
jgi:rhodanese-related sulfurtransferase